MHSNTHSTQGPTGPADDLAALTAAVGRLASRDLHRLPDTALADQTLQLQQLRNRLDGVILRHLAAVDARGAAGAEQARQFGSTASWLRARLQMTTTTAASQLRTARALFCGPLPESATALCAGELSAAHAVVLATSTLHLPDHAIHAAEPTLLEAARRLDPTGLGQVVTHTESVLDPDGADQRAQRRDERQGIWFTMTYDRMVVVRGIMSPEAGHTVQTALEPLSRPVDAADTRSGANAPPTPSPSWPAGNSKPASSRSPVGCGPS
jgi:Domain of unknown function (DUF222)